MTQLHASRYLNSRHLCTRIQTLRISIDLSKRGCALNNTVIIKCVFNFSNIDNAKHSAKSSVLASISALKRKKGGRLRLTRSPGRPLAPSSPGNPGSPCGQWKEPQVRKTDCGTTKKRVKKENKLKHCKETLVKNTIRLTRVHPMVVRKRTCCSV